MSHECFAGTYHRSCLLGAGGGGPSGGRGFSCSPAPQRGQEAVFPLLQLAWGPHCQPGHFSSPGHTVTVSAMFLFFFKIYSFIFGRVGSPLLRAGFL